MPGGGPHPQDEVLFAADQVAALQVGAEELSYLRRRGYALPGALKLVGDRHQLRERQRQAILRATSRAATVDERVARRLPQGAPPPGVVAVDGFNAVITLETALNGGVLVTTLEGGLRDLAGVHGSYRISEVTNRAIELFAKGLEARGWTQVPVAFYLDAPVSNSGRLAAALRGFAEASSLPWTVTVVPDPDAVLAELEEAVVVTGDAVVLDRCQAWSDLAGEAVRAFVPDAWIVPVAGTSRPGHGRTSGT
jgi:hypothetical protein